MKVREIFESALSLIGESPDSDSAKDYTERAPFIVAMFCNNVADVDRAYRDTHGMETQPSFNEICVSLDGDFPLCPRFADSAAYYIASTLVIYQNEELHDRLFSIHCDLVSSAINEIPFSKEKIKNVY